jgi:hypothetical protein
MADPVNIRIDTPLYDKRRSMVVYAGMSIAPLRADVQPLASQPTQSTELFVKRKPSLPKSFTGWMGEEGLPSISPIPGWTQLPVKRKPPLPKSFTGWMAEDRGNNLTGVQIGLSVGNLTYSEAFALLSNTVTLTLGSIGVNVDIPLTSNIITVGTGLIVANTPNAATLQGVQIGVQLGSITPSGNPDQIETLTGVFMRVDLGQLQAYQVTSPVGGEKCVCSVCGLRRKCSNLKKRWDGVMVCSDCWEPRQPQDFVRGVIDQQIVNDTNVEPTDTFLNPGDVKPSDL